MKLIALITYVMLSAASAWIIPGLDENCYHACMTDKPPCPIATPELGGGPFVLCNSAKGKLLITTHLGLWL